MSRILCLIRYRIDPGQLEQFERYAENWSAVVPRCGGDLVGYYMPHEGTNDVAWGMIAFGSLAEYEQYRARLRADPEARQNFAFAREHRFIIREQRNFVRLVEGHAQLTLR